MKVIMNEYENNGYNDSDFFTVLFDRETKQVETVMSGTTRCGMALPEEVAKAAPKSEMTEQDLAEAKATLEAKHEKAIESALELRIGQKYDFQVGDVVEIFKGRKYPKGTQFTVRSTSEYKSAYGHVLTAYLHSDDGQAIKVNEDNCKIVKNSPDYVPAGFYHPHTPLLRR